MSLSGNIKQEIIKKNPFKNQEKSILQGVFLSCGSLIVSKEGVRFSLSSDFEEVINYCKNILEKRYDGASFDVSKVVRSFKNKERFELQSGEKSEEILKDLGILFIDNENLTSISDVGDKAYLKNENEMKAFLAGLFLGSGSVSAPSSSSSKKTYGYHFEVNLQTKNQADLVSEIFSNFDIFPKSVERGEEFIVYLKNSETICDALGLFGANKTVLDLMNKKVDRDMSNLMNRQINCISANLDKTVNASLKQMKAIEVIQNTIGLENLPETLCETALLRIGNPEASLNDLLSLMETKISKGALAQRFDKIIKLANELGDKD